ncbi:MAG TPA: peptidoglycan-associated lipoprotein Pal [Candidatus Saccharimonadia bacterium]|nr:peptidoglycan-associated lipoprotein Pal [Candidatus Saccharimonadia bacterium]
MNNNIRVLLAAAICVTFAACAKKTREVPVEVDDRSDTTEVVTERTDTEGAYGPEDLDTDSCLRQRVVYFDYDRADIRGEAQEILSCHAKYLVDRPSAAVTLEGHADERGTREYNLGLGERRGNAVGGALQANGGSAGQLSVVSYGEERPACNDSDESCWQQNRRVEIVYTAK